MEAVSFIVLAVVAVVAAVVVVVHRNPVVSAMALATNLICIAGLYLVLSAQFIALLQVLVYAGAILVLILFVIMLLNLQRERQTVFSIGFFQRWLGPILAIAFVGLIAAGVAALPGGAFEPARAAYGSVTSVGTELFGRFFYPFEVISLLLVAAMVGAVLLAKRRL